MPAGHSAGSIDSLRPRRFRTPKHAPSRRSGAPCCGGENATGEGARTMTTVSNVGQVPGDDRSEGILERLGLRFTNWAERWFPDAYVFVALAVAIVAVAALLNGASPVAVVASFGDGFWSLITFTMQMAMVVISGYVVASSPPAAKLIDA